MKKLLVTAAAGVVLMTGCSNQSARDYYSAVSVSSQSLAATQTAKYNALASMAEKGDPATKSAAVMALALMQSPTIQPAYIESEALSYTKALAAPIAGIGALWIQSDLSRDLNSNNNKTQQAQIAASSSDQQALLNAMSTGMTASGSTLDTAVSGIVTIAGAGLDATAGVAGDGLDTAVTLQQGSNALTETLVDSLQPIVVPVVEITPVIMEQN